MAFLQTHASSRVLLLLGLVFAVSETRNLESSVIPVKLHLPYANGFVDWWHVSMRATSLFVAELAVSRLLGTL